MANTLQHTYYVLSFTADNCPTCSLYKQNYEPQLQKIIDKVDNLEYRNFNTVDRNKTGQDLEKRDPRILKILKDPYIPSIVLVRADQYDNKNKELHFDYYMLKYDSKGQLIIDPETEFGVRRDDFELHPGSIVEWALKTAIKNEKKPKGDSEPDDFFYESDSDSDSELNRY